jgi:tRNA (guanine-N7-)-methyltransferase
MLHHSMKSDADIMAEQTSGSSTQFAAAFPKQRPILFRPASYLERIDVAGLFPVVQPLEIELGAGDGSFILAWATLNSDKNFIAVERLLGRLRKIEKRGSRGGLQNLRGLRIEISYFVGWLVPPRSVSAFHIYFPDPWPKKKHRRHRLIQAPFVEAMSRALAPGGVVYLRTDDMDYFQQMLEVFAANPVFEQIETPEL